VSGPSLVVFDLDGTLVDSSGDLSAAVNAMLAELAPGQPALDLGTVRSFVGNGAAALVRRSLDQAGLAIDTQAALPVFLKAYSARLLDSTRLYEGVRPMLDALRGRTLAVLTNKPGGFSREILAGLGVLDRFVEAWGPEDAGAKKPDPAGLVRLLERCGVRPADAVLVGDSPIDVATARAAGVASIGVLWGFDPGSLRGQQPDVEVADPAGIEAALARLPVPASR
jgi:phosphoglycolate phosphatase